MRRVITLSFVGLMLLAGTVRATGRALDEQAGMAASSGTPTASARLSEQVGGVSGQVGGASGQIVIDGTIAFVPIGPRIHAYQVEPNGASPLFVGASEVLPGLASSMVIADHRLFVGLYGLGIWVLDVSRPGRPSVIGTLRTYSSVQHLAAHDGYLYIADAAAGLRVIDVRDAARPMFVATVPIPDRGLDENVTRAAAVVIAHDHAVVFFSDDYSSGELVAVFDLADPRQPAFVNTVDIGASCPSPITAQSEDTLFAVCNYRLYAFDVAAPGTIRLVGQAGFPGVLAGGLAVHGKLAVIPSSGYLPADGLGVAVIDVTDSEAMRVIGFVETRGGGQAVAMVGDTALVVENQYGHNDGLRQIDIHEPTQPRADGRSEWLGWVPRVEAGAGYAFAQSQTQVWSLAAGALTAGRQADLETTDLIVREQHLYATLAGEGFAVFDIHADGGLTRVGLLKPDSPTLRYTYMTVRGNRAFVLATTGNRRGVPNVDELQVVDVSSPERPVLLGRINVTASAGHLAAWHNTVLVAEGNRLRVIDVPDAAHPTDRDVLTTDEPLGGVVVDEDGNLFLAAGEQLRAYSLGAIGPPAELGALTLPGTVSALDVAGGRAVAVLADAPFADGDMVPLVHIVDTRDPMHMALRSTVGLPSLAGTPIQQVVLLGGQAFLAGESLGVLAVEVPGFRPPAVYLPFAVIRR